MARDRQAASLATAARTLGAAHAALQRLADDLAGTGAANLLRAVELLAACRGRVAVTGIGASGLIGAKLAATLAASGMPALFVQAAEAGHGDLGMITGSDVILALSGCGEGDAPAAVMTHGERLGVPSIAIVDDAALAVARRATVVVLLPPASGCGAGRPCPHGIMMLALGEALAAALIEGKRLAAADLGPRRPAGAMERRHARVGDLMRSRDAPPLVATGASMIEAVVALGRSRQGAIGVVAEDGRLVGVVSESDLRRHMGPGLLRRRVNEVMSEVRLCLAPDLPATAALELMAPLDVRVAVVIEGARPVGMVHIDDCRRAA